MFVCWVEKGFLGRSTAEDKKEGKIKYKLWVLISCSVTVGKRPNVAINITDLASIAKYFVSQIAMQRNVLHFPLWTGWNVCFHYWPLPLSAVQTKIFPENFGRRHSFLYYSNGSHFIASTSLILPRSQI